VLQSFALQLGLEEDLQSHNEVALLEPSQVHIPKFPLAQRTPDFKVINCETPPEPRGTNEPQMVWWGGVGWGGGGFPPLLLPLSLLRACHWVFGGKSSIWDI
jgi:hypothetical protein